MKETLEIVAAQSEGNGNTDVVGTEPTEVAEVEQSGTTQEAPTVELVDPAATPAPEVPAKKEKKVKAKKESKPKEPKPVKEAKPKAEKKVKEPKPKAEKKAKAKLTPEEKAKRSKEGKLAKNPAGKSGMDILIDLLSKKAMTKEDAAEAYAKKFEGTNKRPESVRVTCNTMFTDFRNPNYKAYDLAQRGLFCEYDPETKKAKVRDITPAEKKNIVAIHDDPNGVNAKRLEKIAQRHKNAEKIKAEMAKERTADEKAKEEAKEAAKEARAKKKAKEAKAAKKAEKSAPAAKAAKATKKGKNLSV